MTEFEFRQRLKQSWRRRVVLVRLGYVYQNDAGSPGPQPVDGVVRMSNRRYVAPAGLASDPDGEPYIECVLKVPTYRRSIDRARLGGRAVTAVGNLVVDNTDLRMESLLGLACDGSKVEVLLGDDEMAPSDFEPMFTALVQKAERRGTTIEVSFKDMGMMLNAKVGGLTTVGGSDFNAARLRTLILGYVHSIECQLKDDGTNLFAYNAPPSSPLYDVEVRDVYERGANLLGAFVDNASVGDFTLTGTPQGFVSAHVLARMGESLDYRYSDLIDFLVGEVAGLADAGQYAGAHPTFTVGDGEDFRVGVPITEERNILDVLDEGSITALTGFGASRLNKFSFFRFRPHAISSFVVGPAITLEDDSFFALPSVSRADPIYKLATVIGNKNWSSQSEFADSVSQSIRALFVRKGFPVTSAPSGDDSYAQAPWLYHKTLREAPPIETWISGADDDAIAAALTARADLQPAMFGPNQEFVDGVTDLQAYFLEIADPLRYRSAREGFDDDATNLFQVCDIDMDLTAERIGLGFVRSRPANVSGGQFDA